MKFIIGIISYFPDDEEIRSERKTLCFNLVEKCKEVFVDVPIMIVAQNWRDETIEGATIYKHEKLGIYNARNKLKEYFLNSEYDFLIMLDDDCILTGDSIDGQMYKKQASLHPDKIGYFVGRFLKLLCMPKEVYRQIPDFEDVEYSDEKTLIDYTQANGAYAFTYPYTIRHDGLLNSGATSTRVQASDPRLSYI